MAQNELSLLQPILVFRFTRTNPEIGERELVALGIKGVIDRISHNMHDALDPEEE